MISLAYIEEYLSLLKQNPGLMAMGPDEEIQILEIAKWALSFGIPMGRFYADKKNYGSDDKSLATGNECFDIVCFDFDRDLEPKRDFAGRRAREALAKLPDFARRDA